MTWCNFFSILRLFRELQAWPRLSQVRFSACPASLCPCSDSSSSCQLSQAVICMDLLSFLYGMVFRRWNGLYRFLLRIAIQLTTLFQEITDRFKSGICLLQVSAFNLVFPLQLRGAPLLQLTFLCPPTPTTASFCSSVVLQKSRIMPLLLIKNRAFPVISMQFF